MSRQRPRARVIRSSTPKRWFSAVNPRVQMTSGRIARIWRSRYPMHAFASSGVGTRFPGGRHLTMFAM